MNHIFNAHHTVLLAQATQEEPPLQPVQDLVKAGGGIVGLLIPIMFTVALLVFIWGIIKYIANADNELKKSEGRRVMIGGIIALFVIASVWGIVSFIGKSLKIDQGGTLRPPTVDQSLQ